MRPRVYLAGPITGLSYQDATYGWRAEMKSLLDEYDIDAYSPMRCKEFLAHSHDLKGDPKMYPNPLGSQKGIITRDRNDVKTCDAMVACFLGAPKVSIGTCVEFGLADAFRKPVVLVMERDGNPHDHAFIDGLAGYRVDTVEEAAYIVATILKPGV
jgi:nucleoside 2-deoxyribosyltransferase